MSDDRRDGLTRVSEENLQAVGSDIVSAFHDGDMKSAVAFASQLRAAVDARISEESDFARGQTRDKDATMAALEAERDTWILAERSMKLEDIHSVNDMTSQIASAAALGVDSKIGLRKARLVEEWLERIAAEKLDSIGGARLTPLDDPAYNWQYSSASKPAPVDHYDLDEVEKRAEDRVGRELWRVVRAGRIDDAEEMCRSIGQYWRAACTIAAGRGSSWISADGVVGGARRSWKKIAAKVTAEKSSPMTAHERAMIALLAGIEGPALAICESYEERLWVRISCTVHGAIEACCEGNFDDLSNEALISVFSQTSGMAEGGEEALSVRKVRAFLSLGRNMNRQEVLALLSELSNCTQRETCSSWVLRLYTHIALLLRLIGAVDESDEEIIVPFENVLCSYIRMLMSKAREEERRTAVGSTLSHAKRSTYDVVARYAAQLREAKAIDVCAELLQSALYADFRLDQGSETRRSVCVRKCANCFNPELLRKICNACVDRVWLECLPGPAEVAREMKEVTVTDKHAIFVLDILIQPEVNDIEEVLRRTSRLARRFGIVQNLAAANLLLSWFPKEKMAALSPEICLNERHELECWHAYMHALSRHNQWRNHFYSNRPLPPSQGVQDYALAPPGTVSYEQKAAANVKMTAYLQLLEEYDRVCARLRIIAIDALQAALNIPGGWMRDITEDADSDSITRAEELTVVRGVGVPMLVSIQHKILHESDMHREAVQVSSVTGS